MRRLRTSTNQKAKWSSSSSPNLLMDALRHPRDTARLLGFTASKRYSLRQSRWSMPEPKLDDMAETEPTTAEAETENGMDLATDNVIREAMQVRAEIIESRAAHKRASAEPDES